MNLLEFLFQVISSAVIGVLIVFGFKILAEYIHLIGNTKEETQ